MKTPPNTDRHDVLSDRYRIAIVNLKTHDRFDLIDTETNRTVRIYRSLTQARIDCRLLNTHATALSRLASEVRARQMQHDSNFTAHGPTPPVQVT
jgi:hypothetical protein